MKTHRLEKAPVLNDGTQGTWETSCFGGTPELWHDLEKAEQAADQRNLIELDGCYWRVEGSETW